MWRRYLRFWGDDAPSDIDNEISFHLEELVRHLRARGLSDEAARGEAAQRFGDVARVRSECVTAEERRCASPKGVTPATRCRRMLAMRFGR